MLVFVIVISTPCVSMLHAHFVIFSTLFAQNIAASPIIGVHAGTCAAGVLGGAVGTIVPPILVFTLTPCWTLGRGNRVVGKYTIDQFSVATVHYFTVCTRIRMLAHTSTVLKCTCTARVQLLVDLIRKPLHYKGDSDDA